MTQGTPAISHQRCAQSLVWWIASVNSGIQSIGHARWWFLFLRTFWDWGNRNPRKKKGEKLLRTLKYLIEQPSHGRSGTGRQCAARSPGDAVPGFHSILLLSACFVLSVLLQPGSRCFSATWTGVVLCQELLSLQSLFHKPRLDVLCLLRWRPRSAPSFFCNSHGLKRLQNGKIFLTRLEILKIAFVCWHLWYVRPKARPLLPG